MTQRSFETRLLSLWMTTRVPMTRANVLFYTKAARKQAGKWLDELVADGVLEVDADAEGEMVWSVRGARRPDRGAETLADAGTPPEEDKIDLVAKMAKLREQALSSVAKSSGGLVLAGRAAGLVRPSKPGDKSLVASGILSLLFGPLGWLYAAPYKVAVPASLIVLALSYFFGWHIVGFSLIFAAVGVAYAWRYNQHGQRTPLFGAPEEPKP